MNIEVSTKNLELSPEQKELITCKLNEISEFADVAKPVIVKVEETKGNYRFQILFSSQSMLIKADIKDFNFKKALNQAVNKIHKKMNKIHYRQSLQFSKEYGKIGTFLTNEDLHDDLLNKDKNEPAITRRKAFNMKPMSEDEAILQMELLGHEFFMFFNSDCNGMCLIYKRKDGNFGLIESNG